VTTLSLDARAVVGCDRDVRVEVEALEVRLARPRDVTQGASGSRPS